MGDAAAAARHAKAQRVLAEASARADASTDSAERAKLRSNAKMEAELLIEVCDYVQADMALKDCRFSSPWNMLIPSACQAEMAALAVCRKARADYVRNTYKMEVNDYAAHLLAVEQTSELFRVSPTSVTEAALRDDALKTSGR